MTTMSDVHFFMATLGFANQGESRAQGTYRGAQALGRRLWGTNCWESTLKEKQMVFRQVAAVLVLVFFVGVLTWNLNMEKFSIPILDLGNHPFEVPCSFLLGCIYFLLPLKFATLLCPLQMGFLGLHLHLSEEGVGSEDARSRKYNKLSRKTQRVQGLGNRVETSDRSSHGCETETEAIRFEFNDFFKEHRNLAQLFELLG